MNLKYNLYDCGVMVLSSKTRDGLLVKIASLIASQEEELLKSQADASMKRFVVEIEKVFEDGDLF